MAWKNAHDALPAWLRSEIEKMAAAVEAAAQVNREVPNVVIMDTFRPMIRAKPTSRPHCSALIIGLDAWKGGRIAGGGTRDPAYQRDREGTVSG